MPILIGIAAEPGGFELKGQLVRTLGEADYEVIDFGDREPNQRGYEQRDLKRRSPHEHY